MCNALPAPRCSAYAEKRLESALRRGDVEDIVRATEGFLVTPRGIQSLRDQGELELARDYQFKRDAMFMQADRKAEVKRATALIATGLPVVTKDGYEVRVRPDAPSGLYTPHIAQVEPDRTLVWDVLEADLPADSTLMGLARSLTSESPFYSKRLGRYFSNPTPILSSIRDKSNAEMTKRVSVPSGYQVQVDDNWVDVSAGIKHDSLTFEDSSRTFNNQFIRNVIDEQLWELASHVGDICHPLEDSKYSDSKYGDDVAEELYDLIDAHPIAEPDTRWKVSRRRPS